MEGRAERRRLPTSGEVERSRLPTSGEVGRDEENHSTSREVGRTVKTQRRGRIEQHRPHERSSETEIRFDLKRSGGTEKHSDLKRGRTSRSKTTYKLELRRGRTKQHQPHRRSSETEVQHDLKRSGEPLKDSREVGRIAEQRNNSRATQYDNLDRQICTRPTSIEQRSESELTESKNEGHDERRTS